MPHFDWAIATDGFLGAILGGAVTGVALAFTIGHDRKARRDDRLHTSADRALLAAANLLATALTKGFDKTQVLSDVVLFNNASITFLARMSNKDPARALVSDVHEAINDRVLQFRRVGNPNADKIGTATRAYLDTVGQWLLKPGRYRPAQDATALVAEYDALE